MYYRLEFILKAHLLNPLWYSRATRRHIRGKAISDVVGKYLERYADFAANLKPECVSDDASRDSEEYLFSIWFQGEAAAPDLVKSCWASVRRNCPGHKLIVLDSTTVFDWISLPDYIVDKWKMGKISAAHFSDICRLELLYRYGGVWLDATDFVPSDFPSWLWDCSFFVYLSGNSVGGWYSFVQNCFIRAKKGDFLVGAWRDMILEYWRNEDSVVEYYTHQMIFRKLVERNSYAAEQFARMPHIDQDPTHTVWYGYGRKAYDGAVWDKLMSAALFQKTEFKSDMARNPDKGSFAWHIVNFSRSVSEDCR